MDPGAAHQSDTGYFHPIPPPLLKLLFFYLITQVTYIYMLYMLTLLFETLSHITHDQSFSLEIKYGKV